MVAGKGRSKVLPCVFARSGVSATPRQLWPGAQWTVSVPGPRDSVWCTAYSRLQNICQTNGPLAAVTSDTGTEQTNRNSKCKEKSLQLNTKINCMFLGTDGVRRTECVRVRSRNKSSCARTWYHDISKNCNPNFEIDVDKKVNVATCSLSCFGKRQTLFL